MKIFRKLKLASDFRHRHLSFLRTLEDVDIVREIGFHQEEGKPVTLKVLFLTGIASTATVQRRLARLRKLGVVVPKKTPHDGRVVHLLLSPSVYAAYGRLGRAISSR